MSPLNPRLLENASDIFSYHIEGLVPYTQYAFRVVATHTHGQTVSSWASLLTAEDSKYTTTHTHVHTQDRFVTDRFKITRN